MLWLVGTLDVPKRGTVDSAGVGPPISEFAADVTWLEGGAWGMGLLADGDHGGGACCDVVPKVDEMGVEEADATIGGGGMVPTTGDVTIAGSMGTTDIMDVVVGLAPI